MTIHDVSLSRRSLLKAGASFAIGVYIAGTSKGLTQGLPPGSDVNIAPNTFLLIGADNTVTVLCKHIEFGQGPFTGMATWWPRNSTLIGHRCGLSTRRRIRFYTRTCVRRARYRRVECYRQLLRTDAQGRAPRGRCWSAQPRRMERLLRNHRRQRHYEASFRKGGRWCICESDAAADAVRPPAQGAVPVQAHRQAGRRDASRQRD